jgi:hypothetical protein
VVMIEKLCPCGAPRRPSGNNCRDCNNRENHAYRQRKKKAAQKLAANLKKLQDRVEQLEEENRLLRERLEAGQPPGWRVGGDVSTPPACQRHDGKQ